MAPTIYSQWTLPAQNGIGSLVLGKAELPSELGEHEVLVKIHAASLNYRDVVLANGAHGLQIAPNVVPGSDGAGEVVSAGKSVNSFSAGSKVIMHLIPSISASRPPTPADISDGLGQSVNGTISEYGVFNESSLVKMPENLTYEEASTLTCSGLTAWNALFGGGRAIGKGDTVLTQGSGGVSIAALQIARAAGATVISTTSSDTKAARLRELGASHTINYKTDSQWGSKAKELTPEGLGVTNVVDVGGMSTLAESLKAVRVEGVVTLTGVLGDSVEEPPNFLDCLWRVCTVRGIILGTVDQFRDLVEFVEKNNIKPVVDERVFKMDEVKDAYKMLEAQKHFSKIVIKIS